MSPFVKALLSCVLALAVLAAGGLWLANRRLSRAFESMLRERVFTDPKRASFEKAGVQPLRGAAFVRGIRAEGLSQAGASWKATVDEVSVRAPISKLIAGEIDR